MQVENRSEHLIFQDGPDHDRAEGSIEGGINRSTCEAGWMAAD